MVTSYVHMLYQMSSEWVAVEAEKSDRREYIDLLKRMLTMDQVMINISYGCYFDIWKHWN